MKQKKKVYTIKALLNLFPLSHVPFIRLTNYSVPFVQLFLYSTHKWSMKWILICPSENGAGNIFIHLLTFSSTWIKLFSLAVIKISVQFRLVQSWNSCTPHLRWNLQVPPIAIFSWRIWAWLCWLEAWSSVGCSSPATNFQPPLKKKLISSRTGWILEADLLTYVDFRSPTTHASGTSKLRGIYFVPVTTQQPDVRLGVRALHQVPVI